MKEPPPFRLGTTSFIIPDHIIPNVRQIGPFFDEIELLVFESKPVAAIPSPDDVTELGRLSGEMDLTYNVHLPVDVSLTAASRQDRLDAADRIRLVIDRFAPLSPTTYTLHLDMEKSGTDISDWQDRAQNGLGLMTADLDRPEALSLETLWYDPMVLAPLVKEYDTSICADLGHHFKYGHSPARTVETFGDRISIIHLHGADFSCTPVKDHLGLDALPDDMFDRAADLLTSFCGTLSIEVFGREALRQSVKRLGQRFELGRASGV